MSIRNQIGAVLVFAAGTFCAAQMASADHHVKSGTYEFVISGVTDLTTVEHLEGSVTGGSVQGTSTIIISSGGPYVVGENFVLSGIIYAKKSAAGMELESPGTLTDSSGDMSFNMARRKAGDQAVGGGGAGSMELVGGTGKYQGVTGACEYKVEYLADNRIAGRGACQWQRD